MVLTRNWSSGVTQIHLAAQAEDQQQLLAPNQNLKYAVQLVTVILGHGHKQTMTDLIFQAEDWCKVVTNLYKNPTH